MTRTVCAIVGAGQGLGRSLAVKFAREGCDLALVSRSETGSRAALEAAAAAEPRARVRSFAADVTRPERLEGTLGDAADEMGEVEILIYNVRGDFDAREPLEIGYPELEAALRLEVVGAFAAARAVLPAMRERGRGSVIFSSATAAYRGSGTHPLYAIGKFGLRALSQSLAKAYSNDGVHIVHVRLDCDLDVPVMRERYAARGADPAGLADPDAVAAGYWWAHCQPRSAWSNEIELRPHGEPWTC